MRTYKLQRWPNFCQRDDGILINMDSSEYIEFIAFGGMPIPADPVPNPAITAIDVQLADIDFRSIRPVREGDAVFLSTLTAQAIELRAARALLPKMV